MKNSESVAKLVRQISDKIEFRMADLGNSYEEAKAIVSEQSIAGPAVWAEVDAIFAQEEISQAIEIRSVSSVYVCHRDDLASWQVALLSEILLTSLKQPARSLELWQATKLTY